MRHAPRVLAWSALILGIGFGSTARSGEESLAPGADEARVETRTYKSTEKGDLEMTVHFPPGWKATDHRPAIVFFFGGGWSNGNIKQFEDQAEALAKRGMVAARADYRVKSRQGVAPDDCVDDAVDALRYLRSHADGLGIDPDRIVASGGSAGGHLAACTAIPDLDATKVEDGKPAVSCRPAVLVLYNPVLSFEGVPQLLERVDNDADRARRISPTAHLTADAPPTLLLYGDEDKLMAQGEEYMSRAKALGVRVEMFTAEGMGHSFFNKAPWKERTTRRVEEFLGTLGYLEGPPRTEAP